MKKKPNTILYFDITIIISIVAIILMPIIFPQLSDQPISSISFFIYIGFLMLFSKTLKYSSQISRFFYWVATNRWHPKTIYNHFILGIFLWFMSFITYGIYKTNVNQSGIDIENYFEKSWEFWLSIALIIIINLVAGTYINYKNKIKVN